MKKFHNNSLKALTFSASATRARDSRVLWRPRRRKSLLKSRAKTEEEEQVDVTIRWRRNRRGQGQRITVTGSRIVRDTYSSISPLQVITGVQQSRNVGACSTPRRSCNAFESAAAGQQVDATFQGFRARQRPGFGDAEPARSGSQPERFILLNGRRLAPSGVEGAPQSTRRSTCCRSSLVDRLRPADLTVLRRFTVRTLWPAWCNVILRKDFDGLELFTHAAKSTRRARAKTTRSAHAWGANSDRGFFGIGAEYDYP
jgi:iron complex outermembrane receptor protein